MKQILMLVCFIVATGISPHVIAQECGRGMFELHLTDSNLTACTYEILELGKVPTQFSRAHLYRGCFVDRTVAHRLKPTPVKTQTLPKKLATDNVFNGAVVDGQLSFHTLELYPRPLLLKLQAEGKTYFLVGLFLSGCNRTAAISLQQKTVTIQE